MADHIPVSNVAPPDRFYLAYFIFLLLGVGFLLPWNAFITAVDYFYLLYPTAHVATLFCVAYMFANLGTLILVLLYGQHVPSRTRIVNGFIAFTLLVLLVPALDALSAPGAIPSNAVQDADSPAVAATPAASPPLALALTVAAVAASGAIDAVVQGSLFGMAGELHERYTQALAAGTSVSGIVVSVVRILTKAVLPNTPTGLRLSAHLYFLLSALILLVCLLAFLRLHSLPVIVFLQSQVAALAEAERRARGKARKEARRAGPGSGKAICHGGSGRRGGEVAGEGHAGEGRMGESVGVDSQAEEREREGEGEVAAEGGLAGAGEDESLEPLVKREATIEEEQVIRQLLQIEDESEWWEQERARDLTGIEGEGEEEGAGAGAAVTVRKAGAEAESVADGAPLMDGCSASSSEIAEIDGEREGEKGSENGVCQGDKVEYALAHAHSHSQAISKGRYSHGPGKPRRRVWDRVVSWWEHTFRSEEAMLAEGRAFSLHVHVPSIVDSAPSIYRQQWEVMQQIWPYAVSLSVVYIVTLSIFPGFIAELQSDTLGSWYPILLIGMYNVFDFFGKMAPVVFLVTDLKVLVALVLARGGFYILYPLCVWWGPLWARHEVIIAAVTGAFGFSNGLLTSLLMMAAPNQVPRDRAESAGMVMVVFLVVGLFIGSLLSWARLGF
ncbi:unnamed protein product [Closterium sp. NIES-64]|nr:unnamed protein product [Closterium sp. NIES-64]CAI5982350.1 unnamed protein product [Closterium sp. NIES-65]CAI6012949.1 unnamed protein product [Closterium sp. NIES-65]